MNILIALFIVAGLVGVHQYISAATPTSAAVVRITEDPNDSGERVPE